MDISTLKPGDTVETISDRWLPWYPTGTKGTVTGFDGGFVLVDTIASDGSRVRESRWSGDNIRLVDTRPEPTEQELRHAITDIQSWGIGYRSPK